MSTDRRDRWSALVVIVAMACVVLVAWLSQPVGDAVPARTGATSEQHEQGNIWEPIAGNFDPWRDSYAQWLMALLSVFATLFTVVAVIWARKAVGASQAQVRAYFRVAHIGFEWEPVEFNQGAKVTVSWENCGNSPARNCLFMNDFVIVDSTEPEGPISQFEQWNADGGVLTTASIGQVHKAEICAISGDDATRIVYGTAKLILYFAVEYTDVFDHTFREELCNVAYFVNPNETNRVRYRAYPHYNRYRRIR